MNRIKITNKVNHLVSLTIPELRISRIFEKEGQSYLFPEDVVEDMFYYPGVERTFREGTLFIEDEAMREKLGLFAEEAPVILNTTQIKAALITKSAEELREMMSTLPALQQQRFAEVAIENKLTDYKKCKVIKEITGRDVIKTVELTAED